MLNICTEITCSCPINVRVEFKNKIKQVKSTKNQIFFSFAFSNCFRNKWKTVFKWSKSIQVKKRCVFSFFIKCFQYCQIDTMFFLKRNKEIYRFSFILKKFWICVVIYLFIVFSMISPFLTHLSPSIFPFSQQFGTFGLGPIKSLFSEGKKSSITIGIYDENLITHFACERTKNIVPPSVSQKFHFFQLVHFF